MFWLANSFDLYGVLGVLVDVVCEQTNFGNARILKGPVPLIQNVHYNVIHINL